MTHLAPLESPTNARPPADNVALSQIYIEVVLSADLLNNYTVLVFKLCCYSVSAALINSIQPGAGSARSVGRI